MEAKFTKLEDIALEGQFSDDWSHSAGSIIGVPTEENRRRCFVNPWMLSTLIFACITATLSIRLLECGRRSATFSPTTQFFGTTQQQIQFSGALTWNESGTLINKYKSGEDIWVGFPSPEMDELWDSLEEVWTVLLEGDEADLIRDKSLVYDGYWISGVDVFHQMHCLDAIRRATYPEYYHPGGERLGRTERLHLDHCIDYIRQAIMCHADTNPVPQHWVESAQRYGADFATVHTCGSFDEALAWARERTAGARENKHGSEEAKDPILVVSEEMFHGSHKHNH